MSNGSYYAGIGAAAAKYPREFIAQHESGHAVVRWALRQPFLKVTLDDAPCPMVAPLPGAVISSGPAMITAVAGGAAEMQLRGLVIRGSQIVKLLAGNGDERFELTDAVTGEVVVAPSAPQPRRRLPCKRTRKVERPVVAAFPARLVVTARICGALM